MKRALLSIAALFASSPGYAFELTRTAGGAELFWDPSSFAYAAQFSLDDPDGERFAAACRAAADSWILGSQLGVELRWNGPGEARPSDGANTLAILAEWEDAFGDRARTVAHTELRYDAGTGQIMEGDVFLNGAAFSFGDGEGAFDTESVVLHELGHVLGIAHTCGDPGRTYPSCFSVPEPERLTVLEAVMAPTLAPGVDRRTLRPDDRDALRVHYPGTATAAAPGMLRLSRRCPEATLELQVDGGRAAGGVIRYASGATGRLEDGFEESEGGADLIARDPATGMFAALYLVEPPAPCDATPVPEEGGCGCRAHRQAGENGAMLGIVLVLGMVSVRRRWSLLPIALAVSALSAGEALAFRCSRVGTNIGPSLVWQSRTIPWYADEALFDVLGDRTLTEEDLMGSFQAWEEVPCSDVSFPLAAVIPGLRAGFDQSSDDNKNVVVALWTGWPYERGAIAVTTSAYDTRTGVVVDADIEINTEHFQFERVDSSCTSAMDLRNTITHEVGHIVGLDHPPNTPRYQETTMFASAPPCEDKKRTLADDDIDGLCSIYPVGNATQQCYPPNGPAFAQVDQDDGFGGCSHTRGRGSAATLLLLVGTLGWLRRRRAAG